MRTVCSVPGCPNLTPCAMHPRRRGSTRRWRALRAAVLRRDGYRCVLCGRRAADVHHVEHHALGGLDVEHNLVSLCDTCHHEQHSSKHA